MTDNTAIPPQGGDPSRQSTGGNPNSYGGQPAAPSYRTAPQPGGAQPPYAGQQPYGAPQYPQPQPPYPQQQYPQGYPVQQPYGYAPGYPAYGIDPRTGRPKYPGTYLTAIILISVHLTSTLVGLTFVLTGVSSIPSFNPNEFGGVYWFMLAAHIVGVLGGGAALIGIIQGQQWGRILWVGVTVVTLALNVVSVLQVSGPNALMGFFMWGQILPIFSIIMLFLPTSGDFLRLTQQFRERTASAR